MFRRLGQVYALGFHLKIAVAVDHPVKPSFLTLTYIYCIALHAGCLNPCVPHITLIDNSKIFSSEISHTS